MDANKGVTKTITSPSLASSYEYEYIDSGNRKRLERFGDRLVIRSCPSALWEPNESISEWDDSDAIVYEGVSGLSGTWKSIDNSNVMKSEDWLVKFSDGDQVFTLDTSDMGQVGVFPEQHKNWETIRNLLQKHRSHCKKNNLNSTTAVLNGFAYTGGSTSAALRVDNVEVVHLDAAKSAIDWAKRNIDLSTTHPTSRVRWIIDDCMTFMEREIKRNKKYDAMIFDPPAFGRGKGGSIWKLDKDMIKLVECFPRLLTNNPSFILLSCHDLYWTPMRLADLLQSTLRSSGFKSGRVDCGEMVLKSSKGGNPLPMGSFTLWSNSNIK
jgi:23S rRNA (cytosine1962-C5)-methyltransferase